MPMYEYACRSCGHQFDKLVRSMSQPGAVACPKCGAADAERKFSTFAVGAEGAKQASLPVGGCGRCGGPGPCGMN